MQTLLDLLGRAEGLSFLESQGVLVSQSKFKACLKAPVKCDLAGELGIADKKLVCSGQQLYVDYRHSVLSKIQILQDLQQDSELFPFFLWVDTDRTGSDNLITKFAWPNLGKKGPITIMPPRTREVEIRFTSLDRAQLVSAIDRLETYLRQSGDRRKDTKPKYQQLRTIFTDEPHENLGEFNLRLTSFLLAHVFGFVPQSIILSRLLKHESTLGEVNLLINNLTDMVRVFNETVQALTRRDIDPQVTSLGEHYLPLFYSCDIDGRRIRLSHHREGQDHFAVCRCKCGRDYKFHLGQRVLSIAELAQTNRWSPDVCFPIFFNDLVSGFVAGKSSAIYLMVLNQVLQKVLAKTPVPVLVPESLTGQERFPHHDSLIYRYLAGV